MEDGDFEIMASVVLEYDVMVNVVAAEVNGVQVAVCVVDHDGRGEGLVLTVTDYGTAVLRQPNVACHLTSEWLISYVLRISQAE